MAAVKFPTFPSVDFSKLDLSKLDLSKLDLSKFGLPKMPTPTLPEVDTDAVISAAKDAAFVTIGLAVLAVQKLQAGRRDVVKAMNDQYGTGKGQFDEILEVVETRVAALEARLDTVVDELEKRLPERAGALLGQAHGVAKAARKQVRELIPTPSAA